MKNLIVYSSLTGNTKMVGEAIHEIMPRETLISPVETAPDAKDYDFVSVGFWVDKGTADKKAQEYLKTIKGKKVALFATLGASPATAHAEDSLRRAAEFLDESNTLVGTFICQGKISRKITEVIKKMPEGHPHSMTPEREALHREAALHPNENDLASAQSTFKELLAKLRQ